MDLSISPSTSDSSPTNSDYNCKVCSEKGHGLHYGVIACRSCAAFFRRTFVMNKKYKCIKKNGQCGYYLRKNSCRFCRFKKCLDVGMVTENVHLDDVSVGSSDLIPDAINPVQPNQPVRLVEYQVIDWKTKKVSTLIDVDATISEYLEILKNDYFDFEDSHLYNLLEKMTYALEKIRENQGTSETLEFIEDTTFDHLFETWHLKMKDTSEWLMYSDEFRSLPYHERVEFFKNIWGLFRRFERYTMSAQVFGKRAYDEKIYVHSNTQASHMYKMSLDQSTVVNPNYDYVIKSCLDDWFEFVVRPCDKLKFTSTEITYMLCQVIWGYASRRLQGQTLAASERFLEEIGNNLHQYYENMCPLMGNCSGRIVKMMKIVNDVLNLQLRREKVMDVAFLFGYFGITFTDPDFFGV